MASLSLPTTDDIQIVVLGASSDLTTSSARIVYKSRPISPVAGYTLGENGFAGSHWGLPRAIELDSGLIMPDHLALSHDPNNTQGRSLFFGQPYGDHQDIYMKSFNATKHVWSGAIKIKTTYRGHVITAHKKSKFAATMITREGRFFLYLVNEEGDLVEWVSTLTSAGYSWHSGGVVAKGVLPETYLGVIKKDCVSHVVFQRVSGGLSVACLDGDQWYLKNVPSSSRVPKGSPIAISGSGREGTTVYFSDGRTIFAQGIWGRAEALPTDPPVEIVGRHTPSSNIGVIYFPRGGVDDPTNNAHVISVSVLDDQKVLVERIRRSRLWPEAGDVRWLVAGGVIDINDSPFRRS